MISRACFAIGRHWFLHVIISLLLAILLLLLCLQWCRVLLTAVVLKVVLLDFASFHDDWLCALRLQDFWGLGIQALLQGVEDFFPVMRNFHPTYELVDF